MSCVHVHQLTLPDDIQSTRCGHSVTAISLTPGLTEVTVFGGSSSLRADDCIAATTIMTFGELNLCRMIGGGRGEGGLDIIHASPSILQKSEKEPGKYKSLSRV